MSLPFSLFLAVRYLRPKRTFVSMVTLLSVLGVAIGVAVLVVVLSVMSGFDALWREKILGFNSHVTVSSRLGAFEPDADFYERLERLPGVRAAAPFVQGLAFISRGEAVYSPILRGIDPAREERVSRVREHLTAGSFCVEDQGIVLGSDLAARLGVRVGDTLSVFSPQSFAARDVIRLPEDLRVTGLFDLGMFDFDIGYGLTSMDTARDLFGMLEGVHGVQVMTEDPFRAAFVARAIRDELGPGFGAQSWMELNRQLFTALRVEKHMMFFLLIFITVVAAFGITNTLITVTVQKTREIGLLKALGFSSGQILRVFIWQGGVAGVLGTAGGVGIGLLALRHRNALRGFLSRRLGIDLLPAELYQFSEIPAVISPADLAAVAAAALFICVLAGLLPALRAARLDPARALRYE